jgi:2'-5' RNA ligase
MRLFIGIPLEASLAQELSALTFRLKSGDDGLRWSAPESWHVTLDFLGNTTAAKFGCLTEQLGEVRGAPVPVRMGEPGFFDRAGVFFVDVVPAAELVALQQAVVEADRRCGFPPEARPYHPHITLARAKGQGRGLRQLRAKLKEPPRFRGFVAEEFVLYESFTGGAGSRYEIRARFPLG